VLSVKFNLKQLIMKRLRSLIPALAIILTVSACNNTSPTQETEVTKASSANNKEKGQAFVEDNVSNPNILQVAIGSADHSTLVAAVQAANLKNVLVNAGPLIVFAPPNEAFEKLQAGTVENLLKPESKNDLANILKFHVSPGNYSNDFLKKFKKLGQANDQNVSVEAKGDDVYIGEAKIIDSVKASNGIIHVVDAVKSLTSEFNSFLFN
jgi:uncharacterized surface protein with fasciclin (FAS1) repeats